MIEAMKFHYVDVGPRGTFKPSGDLQTLPADIDAIFAYVESRGKNKIVLHFHGAFINERKGFEIAAKMHSVYAEAGSHPVTFIWETGLLETLTQNLTSIHRTKMFQKLLEYVIKLAAKKLGGVEGKGVGESLSADEIESKLARKESSDEFDAGARITAELLTYDELENMIPELEAELEEELEGDDEIKQFISEEASERALLDPRLLKNVDEERSKGIGTWITIAKILASVVYRVIKRFWQKRDHGFYPTVVEEILREFYMADAGQWVWKGIKTTAEQMWLPNDGLDGESLHAGTYFVSGLSALQRRMPSLVVDVVGHGAGAIAICHMLRLAAEHHLNLRIRNVLLLAPACTIDLFREEIVDHPNRYQRFRMFIIRDDYECKDQLIPVIYTRSLLYFISGVLEDEADKPLAGMERYLSGKEPYNSPELLRVQKFLSPQTKDRLVYASSSRTAPNASDGFRSTSETHGDFEHDNSTLASLRFLIQQE